MFCAIAETAGAESGFARVRQKAGGWEKLVGTTESLAEAGVDVDHVEYEGMFHGFFSMDAGLDVAAEAQDQVAAALKDAFAR